MKKVWIVFAVAFALSGCANYDEEQATLQSESSEAVSMESELTNADDVSEQETVADNSEGIIIDEEPEDWFMYGDLWEGIDIYENADYVGYPYGYYILYGVSEEENIFYIDEIEFRWTYRGPEENWVLDEYGEPVGWLYEVENDSGDIVALQCADDVEFHIWNYEDDETLYYLSDRYYGRECVTSDFSVFAYYQNNRLGSEFPLFIYLNSEGNIKYIVEYPFTW